MGVEHLSNILDPVHPGLPETVWDNPESDLPTLKDQHIKWIKSTIKRTLEDEGYSHTEDWLTLVLTGSLTTYQYSKDSDCDISLFVDAESFPDWSRAEIIGIMTSKIDGTLLPGTTYPMQCFVVPPDVHRKDLYRPGLRSGYDLQTHTWVEPPDRSRTHDVEREMNLFYVHALEQADKMERLLRYEPHKAELLWHQIHSKRRRDQKEGKGDFSASNIVYKFLANRGLFDDLSALTGEYIAKTAGETRPQALRRWNELSQQIPDTSEVLHRFDDGHTIRRLHSFGDVGRVGLHMRNCWQGRAGFSDPTKPIRDEADHTAMYYMSLHDPEGLPVAGFYKRNPIGNPRSTVIEEALGPRNKAPHPEHESMIQQWAQGKGYDYEPPDMDNPWLQRDYDTTKTASAEPIWHRSPHDDALKGYVGDHSFVYDPQAQQLHIGEMDRHHANIYDNLGRDWKDPNLLTGAVMTNSLQLYGGGWKPEHQKSVYDAINKMHQRSEFRDEPLEQVGPDGDDNWSFGKVAEVGKLPTDTLKMLRNGDNVFDGYIYHDEKDPYAESYDEVPNGVVDAVANKYNVKPRYHDESGDWRFTKSAKPARLGNNSMTSSGHTLREAQPHETVLNWDGREFTPGASPKYAPYTFVNAYDGDTTIGTAMFRIREPGTPYGSIDFESVHVHPGYRGTGVFRSLWNDMISRAPGHPVTSKNWENKKLQKWVGDYNGRLIDEGRTPVTSAGRKANDEINVKTYKYQGVGRHPKTPHGRTFPWIYDPASKTLHMGMVDTYHNDLIRSVPELQESFGPADGNAPAMRSTGQIFGRMSAPPNKVMMYQNTDDLALKQALADRCGAIVEPEKETDEWTF